jgi:hypothetical protein
MDKKLTATVKKKSKMDLLNRFQQSLTNLPDQNGGCHVTT